MFWLDLFVWTMVAVIVIVAMTWIGTDWRRG